MVEQREDGQRLFPLPGGEGQGENSPNKFAHWNPELERGVYAASRFESLETLDVEAA